MTAAADVLDLPDQPCGVTKPRRLCETCDVGAVDEDCCWVCGRPYPAIVSRRRAQETASGDAFI